MLNSVSTDPAKCGPDLPPGLFLRTVNGQASPVLTNVPEHTPRKRGSALINVATALLFALAIGLYVVSIAAQFRYVQAEKHNELVAWIEAVSLDGGMAVASLLALGLSRAGMSARIERVFVVACALGSAAMNLAAADSGNIRSVLAYVGPPLFLAAVVDRTVSVIRRHYLGEHDASAWSQLGGVALYSARFLIAPASTVAGGRRALLAAAPVPAKQVAPEAVAAPLVEHPAQAIEPPAILFRQLGPVQPVPSLPAAPRPRAAKPRTARKATSGPSKTSQFLELVAAEHGELSGIDLAEVYSITKALAPKVGLHEGSARTVLRKVLLAAQGGAE